MSLVKKFLLCVVLITVISVSGVKVSASVFDLVSFQSTSKPGDLWDWSNGNYSFSGTADNENLYTNYYFNNAQEISITTTNRSATYNLNFAVYSKEPWYTPDICVASSILVPGATSTWTVNLNSSKSYYIVFAHHVNLVVM